MEVGILGYPGVGKSTVFAAITGQDLQGGGSGPRRATADVVDPRLDHLREVFQPKRFTRARFAIAESPPLPSADQKRRGDVIAALREPDAFLVVAGSFEQAEMMLPAELHDPRKQLSSIRDDLLLLDLEAVEVRLERLRDQRKRGAGNRLESDLDLATLETILEDLDESRGIIPDSDRNRTRILSELRLFAQKPLVPVLNVREGDSHPAESDPALSSVGEPGEWLCAPIEYEISRIDEAERSEYLDGYGLDRPASERLTRVAYDALDLISFFTVGEDEVRAWPIRRGSDAVTAAGKIHSDLARGFIRAEVTPYARVEAARDAREFKTMGSAELKGKDYIVQDGDTINVRFSISS